MPTPQLRIDAEAELARGESRKAPRRAADKLLHELQVHQVELAMQNENLRQTQHALEESRDRYFDLYEFAPVGYLTLARTGLIVEANRAASQLLGSKLGELLNQRLDFYFAGDDRERWQRALVDALRHDGQRRIDLTLQRRDGTHSEVLLDLRRMAGGVEGLRITLTDITERKQAERVLREKELFNQGILDSVSASIAVLDRDGVIVAVNEPWRRFALDNGLSPGMPAARTEVGVNYLEICRTASGDSSDGAQEAYDGIRAVLDGRVPNFSIEYSCHASDRKCWFALNVTPMHKDVGLVVLNHADITERKLRELARLAMQERLDLVQRAANSGAWDWDITAGKAVWSEELFRLFGLDPGTAVASFEQWAQLLHPEDRHAALAQVERTLHARLPLSQEYRIVLPSGEVRWINAIGNYTSPGPGQRLVGLCIDITERKRMELELAAMRADLRLVLEWEVARHTVAAIAHEVNQPLASISALCEAAIRLLSPAAAAPERLERVVRLMAAESENAGTKLRSLLDSVCTPITAMEPLALPDLLREAVRLAQDNKPAHFTVALDCPDGLPPVRGNRAQVEKVLLNLINNSFEAMHATPNLAGRVWISVEPDGAGVRVSVRDEGPGIAADMEHQLFHPFATSKRGGLGMGLAISRTLVEAQGGKLWCEPGGGAGATFHFTLPPAQTP